MGYELKCCKVAVGRSQFAVGLLLFFSISISANGQQVLKAGTYWDLKPTEQIILDTGSFTFIGLKMSGVFTPKDREPSNFIGPDLGNGTLIDARKARLLILFNCIFEGNGNNTAVVGGKETAVFNSTFHNMGEGIHLRSKARIDHCTFSIPSTSTNEVKGIAGYFPANATTKLDIVGNTFRDMNMAVFLNGALSTLDFTLKCNEFKNSMQTGSNPITRKGLVIEEGVRFKYIDQTNEITQTIGGNQILSTGRQFPNANVWPTNQPNRAQRPTDNGIPANLHSPTLGWPNSSNWIAIENHISNPEITYFRYDNEFVGFGPAISGDVVRQSIVRKLATNANNIQPGDINNYDFPCGNDLVDLNTIIFFPARIAVVDSAEAFTSVKKYSLAEIELGNAIPNPSQSQSRIDISLPGYVEKAVLQFMELTTGRVLHSIELLKRGKLEATIDVKDIPAGIYAYRLISDGKASNSKKLVVVH